MLAQNTQRNPLEYESILSGTFGELRTNHFHSGIDIKTKGKEGSKVYAFSKGYVSRIKISKGGYGKAIYIKHNDGKTTVYAHLKRFSKKIEISAFFMYSFLRLLLSSKTLIFPFIFLLLVFPFEKELHVSTESY